MEARLDLEVTTNVVPPEVEERQARKAVIRRARKMEALLTNTSENEAVVARERLEAFIKKHALTRSEIDYSAPEEMQAHVVDGDFTLCYKIALVTVIAQAFDGRALRVAETVIVEGVPIERWKGIVIALNEDAHAVKCLYAFYSAAIDSMASTEVFTTEDQRESYARGLTYGIQLRFPEGMKRIDLEHVDPRSKGFTHLASTSQVLSKTPEMKNEVQKESTNFIDTHYKNRKKAMNPGIVKDKTLFYQGLDDSRKIPNATIVPTSGDPL